MYIKMFALILFLLNAVNIFLKDGRVSRIIYKTMGKAAGDQTVSRPKLVYSTTEKQNDSR